MNDWISVEDRFPDDYVDVLFLALNELNSKQLMIGHREHGRWTHCCNFYSTITLTDLVRVTHWMDLPKYPNEHPDE